MYFFGYFDPCILTCLCHSIQLQQCMCPVCLLLLLPPQIRAVELSNMSQALLLCSPHSPPHPPYQHLPPSQALPCPLPLLSSWPNLFNPCQASHPWAEEAACSVWLNPWPLLHLCLLNPQFLHLWPQLHQSIALATPCHLGLSPFSVQQAPRLLPQQEVKPTQPTFKPYLGQEVALVPSGRQPHQQHQPPLLQFHRTVGCHLVD